MSKQGEKIEKTKVGKLLLDKLPDVASKFAGVLPDSGVMGILKRVVDGSPEMSSEDKLEFERLAAEQEVSAQEQVTRRWEADASGDMKLPKLIRPLTLITLMVMFCLTMVFDSLDNWPFNVKDSYIDLLQILMLTSFGAYFAGRTVEKVKR